MSYHFLLDLALILLSTKLMGMLTRKVQMPQVVGALLAGLILGPSMLNILKETEFISQISEIGVIVILFSAGVETDIKELRSTGKAGFLLAVLGVFVPMGCGTVLAFFASKAGLIASSGMLENIFIGTILTATSVSITVETLKELGKLDTKVGNTILAAALLDDVIGLIVLTLVCSFAGEQTSILLVLVKIALFFVFAFVVGMIGAKAFNMMVHQASGLNHRRYSVLAFAFCLVMAYCAEHFFGVADIIGAYAAGLVISCTEKSSYIESKFEPLSYLFLTPVFFASVGINADISGLGGKILIFSILLLIVAVGAKIIGCGFGGKVCGFQNQECLQMGIGMACRGEVALIVANRGMSMGILSPDLMTPVIITVVGCAVFTPVLLKLSFRDSKESALATSPLVDRYQESEQIDMIAEQLLDQNRELTESMNKTKAH